MLNKVIQKCGQFFRHFLPVETSLLFLLASVLLWPVPYVSSVSPMLVLAAVYYWAIYRPDLFRPYIVLPLGVLNDAIHYYPLGVSAFVFLAVYQIAFMNRRFIVGQVFFLLWAGYAVLSLIAFCMTWVLLSLITGHMMALLPVLAQYVMTVVFFPFPAWVLIRLQRGFLTQDDA